MSGKIVTEDLYSEHEQKIEEQNPYDLVNNDYKKNKFYVNIGLITIYLALLVISLFII